RPANDHEGAKHTGNGSQKRPQNGGGIRVPGLWWKQWEAQSACDPQGNTACNEHQNRVQRQQWKQQRVKESHAQTVQAAGGVADLGQGDDAQNGGGEWRNTGGKDDAEENARGKEARRMSEWAVALEFMGLVFMGDA